MNADPRESPEPGQWFHDWLTGCPDLWAANDAEERADWARQEEELRDLFTAGAHFGYVSPARRIAFEAIGDEARGWFDANPVLLSRALAAVEEVVAETITAHEEARERDAY